MELKKFVVATMGVAMAVCVNAQDSHLSGVQVYTDGLNNRTNLEVTKSLEKDGEIAIKANGYRSNAMVDFYASGFTYHGYQNNIAMQVDKMNNIGLRCAADENYGVSIAGPTLMHGDLRVRNSAGDYLQITTTDDISISAYNFSSKRGEILGTLSLNGQLLNFNAFCNFNYGMTVAGKITCHDEIEVTKVTASNMNVGELNAKDVKVELNNAADYVFEENYNLKSLNEVESYVKANKHLPGVPSAAEIAKNGMSVSEMSNLFLEKIEELTLHMIQLQKENEALKAKVEALEK